MPAHITLKMQIGPMVVIQIDGQSCREISEALEGYERLNHQVEHLCSRLADSVYPDNEAPSTATKGETA